MADHALYHDGSRRLQDQFETLRLAVRLVEVVVHGTFTDGDRAFIESRPLFFLATADAEGRPDCSYKGGRPGFVRIVEPAAVLAFATYDGNGMFIDGPAIATRRLADRPAGLVASGPRSGPARAQRAPSRSVA